LLEETANAQAAFLLETAHLLPGHQALGSRGMIQSVPQKVAGQPFKDVQQRGREERGVSVA
jgi:hypothetical protein